MHSAGGVCSFYVVFGWNAAARIIKPKESTLNASTASNKSATHTKKSGHLLADRRTCGATACGLRANTAEPPAPGPPGVPPAQCAGGGGAPVAAADVEPPPTPSLRVLCAVGTMLVRRY